MQDKAHEKQQDDTVSKANASAPADSPMAPTLKALPLALICGYLIGSVFAGLAGLIMYLFFTPEGQSVDYLIPRTVHIIAGIIAFIFMFRKFRRHFTKNNIAFWA